MIKMNLEKPCSIHQHHNHSMMTTMASMMTIMASMMMMTKLNLEEEENSLLTTVAPLTDAHAVFHLRLQRLGKV